MATDWCVAMFADFFYGLVLPNVIILIIYFFLKKIMVNIFSQLFEIYETVSNPTLDKMNYIVRIAVNICVAVYISVGFFGYAAFASEPFTGNILMSFSQSPVTDVMKIGFVLSVAFSFPLVIFPCRASLNSLLFKKVPTPICTYISFKNMKK